MTRKKQRRLAFAISLLLAGGVAAALIVFALRDNVLFFYSPSELASHPMPPGRQFRIGGLVQSGSVVRSKGLTVHFVVTDGKASIPVNYTGVLPDLFREGQGVVAMGTRDASGEFEASQILAKHDEKYMPPEVVDALKRTGRWNEGAPAPGS